MPSRAALILLFLLTAIAQDSSRAQKINFHKYQDLPQTVTRVRVAGASVLTDKWDKSTNWRRIEKAVREAALEAGADLVVTPEGVLEGYVINEVNQERDPEKKALLIQLGEPLDGLYIEKACRLAKELDIFFVFGFLERSDSLLFNTAVLIDPEGEIIGKYSKTHFAQGYDVNPGFYRAGEDYPVFRTPFGAVGILICYDRQNPEPARILAIKGAQLLLVPSYGSYDLQDGWNTTLLRTRAYENSFPVVFCHPFQTLLITGSGELKAMGQAGQIVYYDINTDPGIYKDRFKNRRPSTYLPLVEGGDPSR
ncbi:carbon-nitrogen hydrolase family protein [Gemmatimonadota bacterium]